MLRLEPGLDSIFEKGLHRLVLDSSLNFMARAWPRLNLSLLCICFLCKKAYINAIFVCQSKVVVYFSCFYTIKLFFDANNKKVYYYISDMYFFVVVFFRSFLELCLPSWAVMQESKRSFKMQSISPKLNKCLEKSF